MKPSKELSRGITDMANTLDKIPNSISGDGSSFVAQLKNALAELRSDVETLDESNTAQNCQSVSMVTLTQSANGGVNSINVAWEKKGVYGYKEAFVFYKPINSTKWQLSFVTEGVSGVISGVSVGVKYNVKVVPHNIDGGYDKNPTTYTIAIVSSMPTPSVPTQFVVTFDGGIGHWEWEYTGSDYDFFELRTDNQYGVVNENLIARTRDKEVYAEPNKLIGTAYLYVRNNFGVYSSPVTHTYNISQEGQPPKPTLAKEVNGINIFMTDNVEYDTYELQIEENTYSTSDNPYFYQRTSGAIKVRYRWVKEDNTTSAWSNWTTTNISALVLGDDISANAIKTSHLYSGNIDLAGKLAIVGGAVTLNEDGLTCTDDAGDSVVFNEKGMSFVDSNGNEFSAIRRIVMGEAYDGQTITFAKPFTHSPLVICTAKNLKVPTNISVTGDVKIITQATNITSSGFKIECMTCIESGSTGSGTSDIEVYKGKQKGWSYITSSAFANPVSDKTTRVTLNITHKVWGNVHTSRKGGKVEYTIEMTDGTVLYNSTLLTVTTKSPTNSDSDRIEQQTNDVTITMSAGTSCVIKMHYYGNDWSSYADVKINSYTYEVLDRIVLSQGTASFIAADSGEYYS